MPTPAEWLQMAMQASDPVEADRQLVEALRGDPDLAAAYGLRARLAVMRGDCVAAGHYFRVAFARGDRSVATRYGLAVCLNAVGQGELAARLGETPPPPASLAELDTLAELQAQPLRAVMAAPLVPRGTLALMPGERLPGAGAAAGQTPPPRATAEQVSVPAAAKAKAAAGRPPGASPPPSLPPLPSAPPPVQASPPSGQTSAPPPSARRRLPDWVDQIDRTPVAAPPAQDGPEWILSGVEDVPASRISGGIDLPADDDSLEVALDPGPVGVAFRSPVTGRVVRPEDSARERAGVRAPVVEPIPDLRGRAPSFADLPSAPGAAGRLDPRRLVLAIDLPGPVLTAPNVPPRPLCRLMVFGVTPDELIFRDAERAEAPPVRLPRAQVARMDVVNDDQQISFLLADGRQIHLDLRALARAHSPSVRTLVRRLREVLGDDA